MIFTPLFSALRQRAKSLGTSVLALGFAASCFSLTSCTTEEGVVAGALAGAALGGVIGHSSERSNRGYRRGYDRYDRYDGGHYQEPRYRRSNYIPTNYGYSNRGYYGGGGNDCYDYY